MHHPNQRGPPRLGAQLHFTVVDILSISSYGTAIRTNVLRVLFMEIRMERCAWVTGAAHRSLTNEPVIPFLKEALLRP